MRIPLRGIVLLPLVAMPLAAQTSYESELRIGVQTSSMQGGISEHDAAATATGGLRAAELYARTGGIGIVLRTQSLDLNRDGLEKGKYTAREARLLLGPPQFSLEAGILERSTPGSGDESSKTLGRVGFRSTWGIGGSGFRISLDAGVQLESVSGGTGRSIAYRGHDGEALIIYSAPRQLPFYATLGWRLQTNDELTSARNEVFNQSGLVLGLGLQLGGR